MASKAAFHPYGVPLSLPDGDVVLNAGANMTIFPSGKLITFAAKLPANLVSNGITAYQPPALLDAKAPNNSIYLSIDSGKLSYRDPSGVSHSLY